MIDLIKIRRDLHQIPELALHEVQTHDYLLETVKSFPQTWLTVRVIPELPTSNHPRHITASTKPGVDSVREYGIPGLTAPSRNRR